MSPGAYAIAAYVLGLAMLWGYAAWVSWSDRAARRRERARR